MIVKFFDPKKNITAYELAVIVKKMNGQSFSAGVNFDADKWEALPKTIQRHWVDVKAEIK